MSIRITYAGASLLRPGAYSDVQVADGALASPSLGVIALIGEADSGKPFSAESGIDAVTFGPDEFAAIQAKFKSGELVDAAKLAITPSNDPQIRGGAQQILLIKTNATTQASASMLKSTASYGDVKAKNWGKTGNNLAFAVKSGGTGSVIIEVSSLTANITESSGPIGNNTVMTVNCTDSVASTATLSIAAKTLTTTVLGGTAQSLAIDLSTFSSLTQLANYINAQSGYTATLANNAAGNLPVAALDRVLAVDCKVPAAIKKDAFEVRDFLSKSSLVEFSADATNGFVGLPSLQTKTFLSGGVTGGTTGAAIQNAIDACLKRRVNFVVALFSNDAATDIASSHTDSSSTYTINAVHAGLIAHVNQASTVKGRKERQAFAAFQGSFAASKEVSANLNAARVSLCINNVDVLSASSGLVSTMQPHMQAVLAAGMKASAAIGLPNTYKFANVLGVSHQDFDAETQADEAIAANLCFMEKGPNGGFRFVVDNSTYASDLNAWIYNRPAVQYAADTLSYIIRLNTETFIGRRNSDVSEETIKNQLVGILDQAKSLGIIVSDNNTGGKGYKDLKVKINGSIVNVDVTVALVEGIEFILDSIKVQRAG